jgi:hypothetical protein
MKLSSWVVVIGSVTPLCYCGLITNAEEVTMTNFIITEDFPNLEIEFDARFSQPEACFEYLFKQKWPDDFVCKKCGHRQYWFSSRRLYGCTLCEHQHFLTAGKIMGCFKKPITYWFKAMCWFTTRKSGINAVNLKELLGFGNYDTAWTWLQKLRRCTIGPDREKLSGHVEVDEFFIGGQRSRKRECSAEGKTHGMWTPYLSSSLSFELYNEPD